MEDLHPFLDKVMKVAPEHFITNNFRPEIGDMDNGTTSYPGIAFVYKGPKTTKSLSMFAVTIAEERVILMIVPSSGQAAVIEKELKEADPLEFLDELATILNIGKPS